MLDHFMSYQLSDYKISWIKVSILLYIIFSIVNDFRIRSGFDSRVKMKFFLSPASHSDRFLLTFHGLSGIEIFRNFFCPT